MQYPSSGEETRPPGKSAVHCLFWIVPTVWLFRNRLHHRRWRGLMLMMMMVPTKHPSSSIPKKQSFNKVSFLLGACFCWIFCLIQILLKQILGTWMWWQNRRWSFTFFDPELVSQHDPKTFILPPNPGNDHVPNLTFGVVRLCKAADTWAVTKPQFLSVHKGWEWYYWVVDYDKPFNVRIPCTHQ